MRAVIQRVSEASVSVEGANQGRIQTGLVVLLGIAKNDDANAVRWLVQKITQLRIFPDSTGNMNRSLIDVGGQILVVSQFTLHARTRKGTRPSFNDAAPPAMAEPLYEMFVRELRDRLGPDAVATGSFGAMMAVSLVNDGPVTIIMDSPEAPTA